MALINLRNALMAGKRLPYDAEVEYLYNSGLTQYINTGIVPTANTEVSLTFDVVESPASTKIFGGTDIPNDADAAYVILRHDSSQAAHTYSFRVNHNDAINVSLPVGTHTVTMNKYGTRSLIVDGNNVGTFTGALAVNLPMYLFCRNSNGAAQTQYSMPIKLRALQIRDANNLLVRDFIPVRVGTVGYLYDRVSGKLFGNAGTGDFVLGQDVVPVEWLSSDGAQYIDTGYVFQFGDDISTTFQPLATPTQTAYFFGADTAYNAGLNVHYDPSNSNTGLRYCYGGGFGSSSKGIIISPVQAFSASTIYACNGNANKRTINSGENTASVQDSGLNNASVILFCGRRNASVRPASTGWAVASRFFGFDAKRNGAGVRAMKPVRVGTEGAMMDVLTRRIYRNAGTGAFTYGNDLKYPIPSE